MVEFIAWKSELPVSVQETGSESFCGQASYREFRLALVHLRCRLQTLDGGMISSLPLLLGADLVQISACFAKGCCFFFQPALIFIFSLSVCVRICLLLQQRSIANDTFEEGDLSDSAGNKRKQGYTSHCFLARVTSNSIQSFQAAVRCVCHKPVS